MVGAIALTAFSYPALSQTSPITPDGIIYIGDRDTFTSGETNNITVQLLFAGGPLHSEGVRVYFTATDTSIIPAELGMYSLTDKNGIANFTFTANKTGDSNLTASAMSVNSGKTVNKRFHVTGTSSATPAPSATPVPTLSVTPGPATNATATPEPTAFPTVVPTVAPTVGPTVTSVATSVPSTGDADAQARGIIAIGIVLAIALLVIVLAARLLGKK